MANTHTHKHTHTASVTVIHSVDEAMIGSNLDTCRRGPPLMKILGYEHRKDAVGCGGSRQWQTHTRTHPQFSSCYTGWMEPRARIGRNLDTCKRGPPLVKLMSYEHQEDAVGGGGSRQWQTHTHSRNHTHTHTNSVPRDTQDGWSLGQ